MHILQKGVGRHGQNGNRFAQRIFAAADAAGGLQTIHDGHLHIHQDHIVVARLYLGKGIYDLLTIGVDRAGRALGFQQHLQNFRVDLVILGAEELHTAQQGIVRRHIIGLRLLHKGGLGINGKFQHDLKAGALAGGAFHADDTAHQVHNALGDGHTQSRALHMVGAGLFLPREGVENGFLVGITHADAVILHDEFVLGVVRIAGKLLDLKPDMPACGRVLDRVGEDIHQDLVQTVGVCQHMLMLYRGRDHAEFLIALVGLLADDALDLLDLLQKVHLLDVQGGLAALDAAHIQNVVDDAEQQTPGAFQLFKMLSQLVRLVQLVFHQGGDADDGVHRCADIVAHVGQEICLGLAGALGTLQGIHGNLLRALQLGIARGKLLVVVFQPQIRLLFSTQSIALHIPLQSPKNQNGGK